VSKKAPTARVQASGRIKTIHERLDAVMAETRRLREEIDELAGRDENEALRTILRERDRHDPISRLTYNTKAKDSTN
jgi:hypothetical protein